MRWEENSGRHQTDETAAGEGQWISASRLR
jgi:hypothetical protein